MSDSRTAPQRRIVALVLECGHQVLLGEDAVPTLAEQRRCVQCEDEKTYGTAAPAEAPKFEWVSRGGGLVEYRTPALLIWARCYATPGDPGVLIETWADTLAAAKAEAERIAVAAGLLPKAAKEQWR